MNYPNIHSRTSIALVRIRKVLTSALALIGLGTLGVHAISWTSRSLMPSDAVVSDVVFSPDDRYKVVIFYQAGGGGFDPYCFNIASVAPKDVPDRFSWDEKYRVFEESCVSNLDRSSIKWKSANALEITFNPTVGSKGNIRALELSGYADAGRVDVSYACR